MIKPKKLKAGATIALITLSAGMAGEPEFQYRWEIARDRLTALGFKVVLTQHAIKSSQYIDAHPEKRAADLMATLQDPAIDAIICMIGGSDTIRLLPFIDFDIMKQHPKLFIGYSDTTINHFMFHHAGVVSIYGPTALAEFAENQALHSYTLEYFLNVTTTTRVPIALHPSSEWTSAFLDWCDPENQQMKRPMNPEKHFYEFLQGEGRVRGKLLGGCLETFPMMMGTEIWPTIEGWTGKILFLETSELAISPELFAIFLRSLAAQGIFNKVNGVLVGKPINEQFYDEYKFILQKIIARECQSPIPIVYNMNFGHTAPMMSLPIGCQVEIDCDAQKVLIVESPVL